MMLRKIAVAITIAVTALMGATTTVSAASAADAAPSFSAAHLVEGRHPRGGWTLDHIYEPDWQNLCLNRGAVGMEERWWDDFSCVRRSDGWWELWVLNARHRHHH